ncbi:MAG: acyl-CoA dehydrogenase family protein [Bacteroidia bacterium]|nr:acyl-CoA dehydrogenase family protein [Bacteroidia bacterium]
MKIENLTKGGAFLLQSPSASAIYGPEDYSEEIVMLRQAMRDFLNKELEPIKEKFDSKEGTTIAPSLLEKMGEMGFLGLGVPVEFGGGGADFKTELAVGEVASDSFSFSQSIGVQDGLGVYPVLLYGTQEQKQKYLSRIIKAEYKCSYCLTEPGAGSDANSGKTRAEYSEDRSHFILSGQKMWITNSGFADIFFVFCKIEDDKNLSCLIVEKEWGVKLGEEENKLGIHGSSTRQVFFDKVKVPVENLLGDRNKGFKIAMNALNAGRIKIAVAGTAIAKRAMRLGISYAKERVQFNQPIANFGAIQAKIARMGCLIYGIESSWNRSADEVDRVYENMIAEGTDPLEAKWKSVAEFAIECALTKVYGSEAESFAVDEALQIHGGMGFSADSEIETHYRNIRGNRIYEGTNEINRILIPTMLLRKGLKNELPLMEAAMKAFAELQSGQLAAVEPSEDVFGLSIGFLKNLKKAALLVMGMAAQKFQKGIAEEQEVLMNLADILTHVYVFESGLLRAMKHERSEPEGIRKSMALLLMYEAAEVCTKSIKEVVFASAGKEAIQSFKGINRLLQLPAWNLKEERRTVARYFINKGEYKL